MPTHEVNPINNVYCQCFNHPFLVGQIHLFSVTLWLFNIAMENGPFIDGLPIENGDFP